MDPHTSDRNAQRAATALAIILDKQEEIDNLKHDLSAWQARAAFFEEKLKELGWRLATPEESQYLEMVPIEKPTVRINAKGERIDG